MQNKYQINKEVLVSYINTLFYIGTNIFCYAAFFCNLIYLTSYLLLFLFIVPPPPPPPSPPKEERIPTPPPVLSYVPPTPEPPRHFFVDGVYLYQSGLNQIQRLQVANPKKFKQQLQRRMSRKSPSASRH